MMDEGLVSYLMQVMQEINRSLLQCSDNGCRCAQCAGKVNRLEKMRKHMVKQYFMNDWIRYHFCHKWIGSMPRNEYGRLDNVYYVWLN